MTAVLGPTNTGKTHFAIERMLAHKSGMIGLPLRLLAREVYDRVVRIRGANAAALITGEEKIVPAEARYYVCTVEAMPLDLGTAFLAIDEIQLCADPERGHVFTDRLLFARGAEETIFLGADTMRSAIARFVPGAYFLSRARFSDLAYTGAKKLTRLPRRSAVVAFAAEEVYGLADLIRRQRGGAAVVLGALSPRTRNAQVELYQSGDVDFLVATDAIGMGLNMDVDHVAFSALEKFDGVGIRPLAPHEIGQIAGRAGRHMNDGTFGTTGEAEALEEEIAARVEAHRYDPVRVLQWRNSRLAFQSVDALIASLEEPPPMKGLVRARAASDLLALRALGAMEDVRARATSPAGVRLLWDACQLPDFRKLSPDDHARLVHTVHGFLAEGGVLPDDWLARQVARLDIAEGDVATLSGRLAQIRTFTYAAHRPGWVADGAHWQGETRAVEDRLSDALHERLTQRFIDRRTSVLMKQLASDDEIVLALDESGGVSIGGESVGKLEGFRFAPDPRAEGIHGRTLRAAALRGLEGEFFARAQKLAAAKDAEIALSEHGKLWWDGAIVARLVKSADPFRPKVELLADEHLKPALRAVAQRRLDAFLAARLDARLAPLRALETAVNAKAGTAEALPGFARGIAHRLCETFGSLDEIVVPAERGGLIRALRPYGVWVGRRAIYLPKLLRPEAAGLLALLWGVWNGLEHPPAPPQPGLTSFVADEALPAGFLAAAGYRVLGGRAVRRDMLERLEDELDKAAAGGDTADALLPKLVSLLGSDAESLGAVLGALGWSEVAVGEAARVWRKTSSQAARTGKRQRPPKPKPVAKPDSPFAGLAALVRPR